MTASRPSRRRLSRRGTALLAVLLAGTACGSPNPPLQLGFKEVPSDVLLGAPSSPPAAPRPGPGPVALPPPPSVVSLPPPPPAPAGPGRPEPPGPPLPPPPSCPPADPLAAPAVEAPTTVPRPPVAAAYLFDNVGSFAVSGADTRRGTFPPRTVRTVGDVAGSGGDFTYAVSEQIGDVTTTTSYRVRAQAGLPGERAGIFLTGTTYLRSDGSTSSFTPVPEVQLAALPLVRGARSDERGVDPQTQTVMSFTSTVEGKARVVACGEPLDSWTVHLTAGRLVSPAQDLSFDASYQFGTQFGAIVLADSVAFQGTDSGDTLTRSKRATISVVPRTP